MSYVLVCDDEKGICTTLEIALRWEGHKVETVTAGNIAKNKIDAALYDVIVTDIKMPETDGIEVLRHAHRVSPDSAVILITAVDDLDAAVEAVKAGGAFDYIRKGPSLVDDVKVAVRKAMDRLQRERQILALKRDAFSRNSLDNIVGDSEAIKSVIERVRAIAPTTSTVLINGESGTGKELVARGIHWCSSRGGEQFVSINCGAFPETLLESELFGYVRGAFTGATQNRRGLFETANGGTIFLDEISEMTPSMQVKLLRVLQERSVRPVGGTTELAIDVRVVAATNKDLDRMVADGEFREDLYYRLNVIPIRVPSLRERRDDIPILANHFMKKYAAKKYAEADDTGKKRIHAISQQAIEDLCSYEWPGNVRQLENTIERAVALTKGDQLEVELPRERPKGMVVAVAGAGSISSGDGRFQIPEEFDMEKYIADLERSIIKSALEKSNDVGTRAAGLLNLSYRSFRHLLKKYDL
jgi:two-component system response regulator PilR (NtrC family)